MRLSGLKADFKKFFSRRDNIIYTVGMVLLVGVATASFMVSRVSNIGPNLKGGCTPVPFDIFGFALICPAGNDPPPQSVNFSCYGEPNSKDSSIRWTATFDGVAAVDGAGDFAWQFDGENGYSKYGASTTITYDFSKDPPGYQPKTWTATPTFTIANNSITGDTCKAELAKVKQNIKYTCVTTQGKNPVDTQTPAKTTGGPVSFDVTPKDPNLNYIPATMTYGEHDVPPGGIVNQAIGIQTTDKGCKDDQACLTKTTTTISGTCPFKLLGPPPAPGGICTVNGGTKAITDAKYNDTVTFNLEKLTANSPGATQTINWSGFPAAADASKFALLPTFKYSFTKSGEHTIKATIKRADLIAKLTSETTVICPSVKVATLANNNNIENVNLGNIQGPPAGQAQINGPATGMTCAGKVDNKSTLVHWTATLNGKQPANSKAVWKDGSGTPGLNFGTLLNAEKINYKVADLQKNKGASVKVDLYSVDPVTKKLLKPISGLSATCSLTLGDFGSAIPIPADAPKITSCKGTQTSQNGDDVQVVWSAEADDKLLPTDVFLWGGNGVPKPTMGQQSAPVTYKLADGFADAMVFLTRNGQFVDITKSPCHVAFQAGDQPPEGDQPPGGDQPPPPGQTPTISALNAVQNNSIVTFSYSLSNSSGNATINAQLLDQSKTAVKTWDPLTNQSDGSNTLIWDSVKAGQYTFIISGTDGANIIPNQTKNFIFDDAVADLPPPGTEQVLPLSPAKDVVNCTLTQDTVALQNNTSASLNCTVTPSTYISAFVVTGDVDPSQYTSPDLIADQDIIKNVYTDQQFSDPSFLISFDGKDKFDSLVTPGDYTFLVYGRPDSTYDYDISKQKFMVVESAPITESQAENPAQTPVETPPVQPTQPAVKPVSNLSKSGVPYPKDVYINHWAYALIRAAYDAGFVQGYPNGTFRPDKPVKRDEAVKMGLSILGVKPAFCYTTDCGTPFLDLNKSLSPWVRKAWEMKIVKGYNNLTFGANNLMTRGEAVAFIAKLAYAMKIIPEPFYKGCYTADCGAGYPNIFKDITNIATGAYLKELLNFNPNIVQGVSKGKFNPNAPITRAELLKILLKLKDFQQ